MKTRFLSSCLLVGALAFAIGVPAKLFAAPPFPFFGSPKQASEKGEIQWQKDIFAAHKVAKEQNKPMLLVFGADWCGFCKKLESQTLTQPQLADYINKNFVAVHLDADKDERVTKILGVESLPCSVVLSPNADLLGKIEGYLAAEPYQRKLVAAKQGQGAPPVTQVKAE